MRSGTSFSNESTVEEMRLVFFLNSHLKPFLDKDDRKRDNSKPFNFARILEIFLWLHHGVEVAYFPIESSRRLVYEYFPLFLEAYESPIAKESMETWFSPALRAIFTSEFNGNANLFSFNEGRSRNSQVGEFQLAFESLLILATGFNQDGRTFQLIEALIAPDSKVWGQMMNNYKSTATSLSQSTSQRDELAKSTSVLDGFFEVVKYLQAYRVASSNFLLSAPTDALQEHLRLLKETQQWRLNFGYPKYRERFKGLASVAVTALSQDISDASAPELNTLKESFLNEIYGLMTDWGAPMNTQSAGA